MFLSNGHLAVYGHFLVLQLRVSTQKNTVRLRRLFCSKYKVASKIGRTPLDPALHTELIRAK